MNSSSSSSLHTYAFPVFNCVGRHVKKTYPGVKVFAEDRPDMPQGAEVWRPGPQSENIDLVVTLGGDGTILHAASLFSLGAVPPVLSFSMGTLGFLLPFRKCPANAAAHEC